METLILYGFLIAVFAVSYRLVMAYEPILNWWFRFGLNYSNRFFYRPIWGCEKCFAGQIAFWTYLFSWISSYLNTNSPFWCFLFKIIPNYHQESYNALNGLIYVFLVVFITNVLAKLYEKYLK
jgi:hypothetical protein